MSGLWPADTKTFVVSVYGYADEVFKAETIGKARYRAYRAFREAGPAWSFHQFLTNTRVWETTAHHHVQAAR